MVKYSLWLSPAYPRAWKIETAANCSQEQTVAHRQFIVWGTAWPFILYYHDMSGAGSKAFLILLSFLGDDIMHDLKL